MALCYAPFLHRIIYTDGTSGLCCVADKESYFDKDYSDWNGKDYQNRLKQVGFTVKMLAYAEQLTSEEQTRYAVPANEIIPVCTKAN